MSQAQPFPEFVRFGRMAPTVSVSDLTRSLSFYRGVLGFAKVLENGNPIGFAILKRDAAELHWSQCKAHKATAQNVAHLMVSDATALYEHLEVHGVRIVKAVRDAGYGLRTFVMADPDGNRIDVGELLWISGSVRGECVKDLVETLRKR